MTKISLKIITQKKIVFEGNVNAFYAFSTEGRFGILPNHEPVTTVLEIGVTKIITDEEPIYVATMGGILNVRENAAVILTDMAELGNDIDAIRAKEALERARARLEAKSENVNVLRAQIALKKATVRLSASEKHL